jgi:hypothetical protein
MPMMIPSYIDAISDQTVPASQPLKNKNKKKGRKFGLTHHQYYPAIARNYRLRGRGLYSSRWIQRESFAEVHLQGLKNKR